MTKKVKKTKKNGIADDNSVDEKVEVVAKSSEEVQGRQKTEISCPHCFLLVDASVVADTGECSHCGAPIS